MNNCIENRVGSALKMCRVERYDLESLSMEIVPVFGKSGLSFQKLSTELFSSEDQFVINVRQLISEGILKVRETQDFRKWDCLRIAGHVLWQTRLIASKGPISLRSYMELSPFPRFTLIKCPMEKIDDDWFWAADAARSGAANVNEWIDKAQTTLSRSNADLNTSQLRKLECELENIQSQLDSEFQTISNALPAAENYWTSRLSLHAELVLRLEQCGLLAHSRFASSLFSWAVKLAGLRLKLDRRELRRRVGRVNANLLHPALTTAEFSASQRIIDLANDKLLAQLEGVNTILPESLRLQAQHVESFVSFLFSSGLDHWANEVVREEFLGEEWHTLTRENRQGVAIARYRTMAVLMEDGMLSMAEHAGINFADGEKPWPRKSRARLKEFLTQVGGENGMHFWAESEKLLSDPLFNWVLSAEDTRRLGNRFGIWKEKDAPLPATTVGKCLASLVLIRDLTSHRFPVKLTTTGDSVHWAIWNCLNGMERTVIWSALILWAFVVDRQKHTTKKGHSTLHWS